jgi:hypothetical protein
MMKENATAETTVENWVSQRDQAKAQLELAKINLGYTKVTAPFAGRIGARQVDPGNLVGSTGATTLATLEQLKPIYVNFNLNERDALRMRDLMRQYHVELGQNVGKAPVDRRTRVGRPIAVGDDEHVGGDQRFRFRAEHTADALDDRPQRDNRRDADGDADEKKEETLQGRPRFAHGHPQDEHHDASWDRTRASAI